MPSFTIALRRAAATPMPAEPAPATTIRWSLSVASLPCCLMALSTPGENTTTTTITTSNTTESTTTTSDSINKAWTAIAAAAVSHNRVTETR
jgi:hypothetical protein